MSEFPSSQQIRKVIMNIKLLKSNEMKSLFNAALQNDLKSQEQIADMYFYGNIVIQNYKKAHMWYKIAVNNNSISGLYMLGLLYLGNITSNSDNSSFFKPIDILDSYDEFNILSPVEDIKQDINKAFNYFYLASLYNHEKAKNAVNYLYQCGYKHETKSLLLLAYTCTDKYQRKRIRKSNSNKKIRI